MAVAPDELLTLGEVSGVYGVHGWVRVYSYTDPIENILDYSRWHVHQRGNWQVYRVLSGRRQGKGLVAALEGIGDRDEAQTFIGAEIAVPRAELPTLPEGEYYWADLEGLQVETVAGEPLGAVDHLFATGANDVLVVSGERERLIPFVMEQVVQSVDLEAGVIRVDWDPEF